MSVDVQSELAVHGMPGTATVLRSGRNSCIVEVLLRVRPLGSVQEPYRVRVPFRNGADRLAPGDRVECRVDPGDLRRVLLLMPKRRAVDVRTGAQRILSDGRRAEGVVLAATAVGRDAAGAGFPILRLDLELTAWDEPAPWRVRVEQSVPLDAVPLVERGSRLVVGFFGVDRGETVAVDWAASQRD